MGSSKRNRRKKQATQQAAEPAAQDAAPPNPLRLDAQVGAILRTDAAKEAPDLDEALEAEAEAAPAPAVEETPAPAVAEAPSVAPASRARKLAQLEERRSAMGEPGPPLVLSNQPDTPALTQEEAAAAWAKDDAAEKQAQEAAAAKQAEEEAAAKRAADAAAKKALRAELVALVKASAPRYDLAVASPHHQPPALAALRAQADTQAKAGELELAKLTLLEFTGLTEQVIDFDQRLAVVVKQSAELPAEGSNKAMSDNMTKGLAAYLASPWTTQTDPRGGLPKLEERLAGYQDSIRNLEAVASGNAAHRALARAESRISRKGEVIETKAITSFPAQEQLAINDALAAATGGARNWPGKWAEDHGNVEGNLPGGGGYLEYYVRAPSPADGYGKRRLVRKPGSQRWFYSNTHYGESGKPAFWVLP